MKSTYILVANWIFFLFSLMYLVFADNRFPNGTVARIMNIVWLFAAIYVGYNLLNIYILKKEKEESGLLYKVLTPVASGLNGVNTFIQPVKKELSTSIIIAAAIIVISLIFIGLPGGIWLELLAKTKIFPEIKGDNAWPAAILMSILWTFCFPLAVLVKHYFSLRGYSNIFLIGIVTIISWVFISSALTLLLSTKR